MARGRVSAYRVGNAMVLQWQDKCNVTILSTTETCNMVMVLTCRDVTKGKPEVVELYIYNKNILVFDTIDLLATLYSFLCKSVKWWQKVMFLLLLVSIFSSYILYTTTLRQLEQQPQSHLQFCREFMLQFVANRLQLPPPSHSGPHVDLSFELLCPVNHFS